MLPNLRRALAPIVLAVLLTSTALSADVKDEAAIFSFAAVQTANVEIKQIKDLYNKEVIFETFQTVDNLEQYRAYKDRAMFLEDWGRQRYRRSRAFGIHVFICRNPLYVAVFTDEGELAFPKADGQQLVYLLHAKFKEAGYDKGLLEAVNYIRNRLDANIRGRLDANVPAPSPAPKAPDDELTKLLLALGIVGPFVIGFSVLLVMSARRDARANLRREEAREAREHQEKRKRLELTESLDKGRQSLILGDYDLALRCAEQALLIDPSSVPGFILRGDANLKKEAHGQAILDYSQAIRFSAFGERPHAYCLRGEVYLAMQDYNEAIINFAEAVQLDPTSVRASHFLSIAYQKAGIVEPGRSQRNDKPAAGEHVAKVEATGRPSPQSSLRQPSVELQRQADSALVWGLVCIVLGWTVIVPIIAVCVFAGASAAAEKEKLPTPTKATVGLVLALLFGIAQGLTVALPILKHL